MIKYITTGVISALVGVGMTFALGSSVTLGIEYEKIDDSHVRVIETTVKVTEVDISNAKEKITEFDAVINNLDKTQTGDVGDQAILQAQRIVAEREKKYLEDVLAGAKAEGVADADTIEIITP